MNTLNEILPALGRVEGALIEIDGRRNSMSSAGLSTKKEKEAFGRGGLWKLP